MLVHVVTSKNAFLYHQPLFDFFQRRYDIFVLEKGWFPPNKERLEMDIFDNDNATYLIGIEGGRVVVGSRFIPMSKPNLLGRVFPHMSTERLTEDPFVAEWTRGFVVPERRGASGFLMMAQFCTAVMEWALAEGIEELGGLQDVSWLPLWRRLGWHFRVAGPETVIDGDPCIVGYCQVGTKALETARKKARISDSILVHEGPYAPFVEQVRELALA